MTDIPNHTTIAATVDVLVQKYRQLAKMCREHGERMGKAFDEQAARLAGDHQEMASAVLAAYQDMKDDIAAFIGESRALHHLENELKNLTPTNTTRQ